MLLLIAVLAVLSFTASASASPPMQSRHDRNVIRFFVHHPRLADTPAGRRALWRVLAHVTDQLRQLQSIRDAQPAHLALWRCIAGYPGARPGGGAGESWGNPRASNGSHFNILQMTDPWAGIHPIGMSPEGIMAAAEAQYAASGYSRAWLIGQWGQTIGPCWGYA